MASEQRIGKLKEMIANDPNDSFSRYALALEYNGTGEISVAVEILEELIKNDSKYVPAYHQLGQLLAKLNRTMEAKKIYRQGIDISLEQKEEKEAAEMREELEDIEDEW